MNPILAILVVVSFSYVFIACGTTSPVTEEETDPRLAVLEAENTALEAELAEIRAAARSESEHFTAERDELERELRARETTLGTVSDELISARARVELLERDNAAIQALIDELRLVVLLLRDVNRPIEARPETPAGVTSPEVLERPNRAEATIPAFEREPPAGDPAELYTRDTRLSPSIERSPRSPIAAIGLISVRDPDTNSFRYYSERFNPQSENGLYFVIEQSAHGEVRLRPEIRITHETEPSVTDALALRAGHDIAPLPFTAAVRVTDGRRWVETISLELEEFEQIVRAIEDERAELVFRTTTRDGTETTTRALSVGERDAAIVVITAFIELGGQRP